MTNSSRKEDLPDLAPLIHQAQLDPHIPKDKLNENIDAALRFGFSGFCTSLINLPSARKRLGSSNSTRLIAVIAFPFGAIPNHLKKAEAEWAASHGAEELDVVPNFSALKENQIEKFAEELESICSLGLPVRVILDVGHLPQPLLPLAIDASVDAGISGVQTGNGFGPAVTASHIYQMTKLVRGRCAIKAAGGIQTTCKALEVLEAGASILGTSKGPELMKALRRGKV